MAHASLIFWFVYSFVLEKRSNRPLSYTKALPLNGDISDFITKGLKLLEYEATNDDVGNRAEPLQTRLYLKKMYGAKKRMRTMTSCQAICPAAWLGFPEEVGEIPNSHLRKPFSLYTSTTWPSLGLEYKETMNFCMSILYLTSLTNSY